MLSVHIGLCHQSVKSLPKNGLRCLTMGPMCGVIISDPIAMEKILKMDDGFNVIKPELGTGFMKHWFGDCDLILSNGHVWRQRRQFYTKILPLSGMENLITRSNDTSQSLINHLREFDGQSIKWKDLAFRQLIAVGLNAIIGTNCAASDPQVDQIFHLVDK